MKSRRASQLTQAARGDVEGREREREREREGAIANAGRDTREGEEDAPGVLASQGVTYMHAEGEGGVGAHALKVPRASADHRFARQLLSKAVSRNGARRAAAVMRKEAGDPLKDLELM